MVRGAKREVISRCYNLLLRGALGARFTDAQCGFKAIRRRRRRASCCRWSRTPTWFFDTELLVLAERSGLRIHEVPVDWVDDPDSPRRRRGHRDGRPARGLAGRRALAGGRLPVEDIARRLGRGTAGTRTWQQLQRFAVVGVLSTLVHLGLFAALRSGGTGAQVANLVALLVATVANTALNRRWTFGVQGRGAVRHQAQGLALFGVTWLLTAGGLGLLHLLATTPATAVQTAVVALATALSTVLRFVAMRTWMFRPSPQSWLTVDVPDSSSNTTRPVQSNPSTEPWQTATSP